MTRKTRVNSTQKKSESGCLAVFKRQAIEFCLSTGLHGYKYVGQLHRSKTERIIWAVIIFASLCCAIVTMVLAYDYYATRPTLTVIESTHHGIWNYPFPAVTVCNMNRVSLNLAKRFVENLKMPPNVSRAFVLQEMKLLVTLLHPGMFDEDVRKNLTRLQDIFDSNDLPISTVLRLVTQNCSGLIRVCKWKSEVVDCDGLFQQSFTRDGICCSFNYYTLRNAPVDTEPRRVTGCGYQTGLKIILSPEPEDYFATTRGSFGAKIMLHEPFDFPDYNAENILVGLNSQVFMSVSPEVTYTTQETRSLAIPTRDCIFPDEGGSIGYPEIVKRNRTFIDYSYLNCMAECRAVVIKEKCNCTPYYMSENGTRTCDLRDVECLANYKAWYDTSWPGTDMRNATNRLTIDVRKRPCGCMPDCTLYRYPVESSAGMLDSNIYYGDGDYTRISENNTSLQNKSVVHVFFSDLVSIQFRRDVYYNWYSLFASFGGLLGLFSGFSLMSAFELVYFFIIRVITNEYTRSKR